MYGIYWAHKIKINDKIVVEYCNAIHHNMKKRKFVNFKKYVYCIFQICSIFFWYDKKMFRTILFFFE